MNIVQTSELLAEIQIGDSRRIDDAVLIQWHKLVGDLEYPEALEAMMLHRRESTAWLTAAHIRANVDRMRIAALGTREDENGNLIDPEPAALDAARRAHQGMREVTS